MSTPTGSQSKFVRFSDDTCQNRKENINNKLKQLREEVSLNESAMKKFKTDASSKLSEKMNELQNHYRNELGECCSEKKDMYDTVMKTDPGIVNIKVPDVSEIMPDKEIEKLVCDPNTGKTTASRGQTKTSSPVSSASASASVEKGVGPAGSSTVTAPPSSTAAKPAGTPTSSVTGPFAPSRPVPTAPTATAPAIPTASATALPTAPVTATPKPTATGSQSGGMRELVMRRYF